MGGSLWGSLIARLSTDANGKTTGISDGAGVFLHVGSPKSVIMVGGDHPYDQWSGTNGLGVDKLYADRGIKPYLAINTAVGVSAPGDANMETWAQVGALRAEVIAHGHRHTQDWSRMNGGIIIAYAGVAAAATVSITGTPKTLTLVGNGGAEDTAFDLTAAAYDTLTKLVAAIDALPGWTCTLGPELTGSERSIHLLNVATARNVVSGGAATRTRFAVSGGIVISYGGTKQAAVQISSNILYILIDGVAKGVFNLALAAYDTLSELVTAINAAGLTGIKAALCNDDASTENYQQGDEASTSLDALQWLDITRSGYVLAMSDGKITYGQRINAGLPHSYMIERQIEACIDTAAANGVTITDFAQSGTGLAQWHLMSSTRAQSFRMDKAEWNVFPSPTWAAIADPAVYSHYAIDTTIPKESIIAAIDAAADSPGCIVNFLNHALTPSGTNGYTFADTSSAHPYGEDDFITCMDYLKTQVDAGTVYQMTPSELRAYRNSMPRPQNYIFNPKLRNSGVALLSRSDGYTIPGWQLTANGAGLSAASISSGVLSMTTTTDTAVGILAQPLSVEHGKSYRVGCRVEIVSKTSGPGVRLKLDPRYSGLPDMLASGTTAFWSSIYASAGFTDLELQFSVPTKSPAPARVIGYLAGPYNIVGATNDTLTVTVDTLSFTTTLTAGAAQTASVVAAEINAAIAADADFAAKQEYWNIASVVAGCLVITAPNVSKEYWSKVTVTGNAAATLFGSSVVTALPSYIGKTQGFVVPIQFTVSNEMTGSVNISGFYCREVNAMN